MLLRLVTEADKVQPLGFVPEPNITFIHPEDAPEHEEGLVRVSTCDNQLTLPVISRYREFKTVMTNAIVMMQVFTTL